MTVSGISSVGSSLVAAQASLKDRQADFQALGSALNSGDLAGARKAFADFLQTVPGANGVGSVTGSSPIGKDLQALDSALQSGDVAGAQQAFAGLQQEVQKAHGHHHHRHHHKTNSATDPTASSAITGSTDVTGTLGSTINVQG